MAVQGWPSSEPVAATVSVEARQAGTVARPVCHADADPWPGTADLDWLGPCVVDAERYPPTRKCCHMLPQLGRALGAAKVQGSQDRESLTRLHADKRA